MFAFKLKLQICQTENHLHKYLTVCPFKPEVEIVVTILFCFLICMPDSCQQGLNYTTTKMAYTDYFGIYTSIFFKNRNVLMLFAKSNNLATG
jgi:hypothetical protein